MLFSIVAVMLIICVFILAGNGAKKEAASKEIRVGLFLYRGDDTFISTLRSCIEEIAKEYERTEGIKVTLDILDAKSSQNTQTNQVDRLLELGCDALCVNIVDRFAASVVIDKAMGLNQEWHSCNMAIFCYRCKGCLGKVLHKLFVIQVINIICI